MRHSRELEEKVAEDWCPLRWQWPPRRNSSPARALRTNTWVEQDVRKSARGRHSPMHEQARRVSKVLQGATGAAKSFVQAVRAHLHEAHVHTHPHASPLARDRPAARAPHTLAHLHKVTLHTHTDTHIRTHHTHTNTHTCSRERPPPFPAVLRGSQERQLSLLLISSHHIVSQILLPVIRLG